MVVDKKSGEANKSPEPSTPQKGSDAPEAPVSPSNTAPTDPQSPQAPQAPPAPVKLELQQIMEKELGLAKVCDVVSHESMDLIYQHNLIEKYKNELAVPLFGKETPVEDIDGGRMALRDDYIELKIAEKMDIVLNAAEAVAAANGIKEPMQKRLGKLSLAVMSILMLSMFVLMGIFPEAGTYIMLPVMFGVCLLPQFLRTSFMKKWAVFKEETQGRVIEAQKTNIADLKSFVQSLLNDIRERLIANRVPLQAVQFVLFSKDYENLQFIADQSVRGMKNYVVQFTYPPGMQPFEMPAGRGMGPLGGAPQSQGQGVPEDDENDRFIILKKAVFDLDGVLTEYQVTFPEKAQTEKVEDLLNTAEFQPVNNPRAVIPSFKSNNKIKCECGEPLELAEMKSVVTESPKFEAYFVIGKKCKCGRNPFVLFNSPGNKEIPSDLKPLFE